MTAAGSAPSLEVSLSAIGMSAQDDQREELDGYTTELIAATNTALHLTTAFKLSTTLEIASSVKYCEFMKDLAEPA